MKNKLRNILVSLGIVGLIAPYQSSLSNKSEIQSPEYNLEGARKQENYLVEVTPYLGVQTVVNEDDLKMFKGARRYYKSISYFVDGNKDGKIDVIHNEFSIPSDIASTRESFKIIMLYVDDPDVLGNYDGVFDRALLDEINHKEGKFGADGDFDREFKLY